MKKTIIAVCFGLMLTSLTACKEDKAVMQKEARPIRSFVVEKATVLEEGSLTGRARAAQAVDLSFRIGGSITERPVQVGDVVKKGDIVAKIDPSDFQAEVRRIQGSVDQAEAALQRAKGEYKRETNILRQDPGATSQSAVDRKKESLERAKANLKSALAGLQASKNQLSYTELLSPISGKIVATYVENYETVQAKQNIVRLLDNTKIKFDVNVPEQFITYSKYVKELNIVFDAFPQQKIPAEISEVAAESSSTTRTYQVTLLFEQPENIEILAGMAGRAEFLIDRSKEVNSSRFIIPNSSVFSLNDAKESYVWIYDESNKSVKKRKVTIDRISEKGTEVVSGLDVGEIIASAGVHFLKENTVVRLIQNEKK